MKKILGLDLGTNSIGWAVVNEGENENEKSSIVKLGVRVNPLTVDELTNFEKGKSITTNADRTLKRSMRRNLQRYKLRRENLIEVLKENHIISDESILTENGNRTTFETYRFRAQAATEEIPLDAFARVLLMINKKRGYKSSRKAKSTEEGQLIDGMAVAKQLYEKDLTPGQFTLALLKSGKNYVPSFYRSDLRSEFDRVWNFQSGFYPSILTDSLKNNLEGKNKTQTWAICKEPFGIVGMKRETKGKDLKIENYQWRCNALSKEIGLEELAIVLQEINGQISGSSGYLGDISDRSKELYFNKQTVGQYQMAQLEQDPNYSLKNQVFYRQDYLDEFERIWETQSKFHKELTPELKKEIRDIVIFYQRPLKSQKGLISFCELEQKKIKCIVDGKEKEKITGSRVCPKSSPLFQEFKMWQRLNDVKIVSKVSKTFRLLEEDEKKLLAAELAYKEKMSKKDALKLLGTTDFDLNFDDLEGNRTQAALFKAYQTIIEMSGHGEYDFSKMKAMQILETVQGVFSGLGFNTDILSFNSSLEGDDFEKQPMYQLWHLLYSFEGDKSLTGNDNLVQIIHNKYGFDEDYAAVIANVTFQDDYGSLSTKAMRKILPFMKEGNDYSVACEYAGYRHSKKSLTKEELEKKVYKDRLALLPKNSLRNPVVEKILNQMVNVVNQVIDTYGKPDEIRIELARELKKSAKEREEMTKQINTSSRLHEEYKNILENEFHLPYVSRNDILRYKLYLELETNGFKTLYSNTYIPKDKLFSKEFDIEHIIPQAKLFDDSFSNKTLESRQVNLTKSNTTALDYVKTLGDEAVEQYKSRIENLFRQGAISKSKHDKLLMAEADIPSGFINRDLRDSQYIAKQAREMLEEIVKFVVPTTGSITDRLRDDWQLVDVMKELNWDKYAKLGMVSFQEDCDGRKIGKINDWTKRNDHRHHAMDALTIAFTKRNFIQYLNNLNARVQKGIDEYFDLDEVEIEKLAPKQRTAAVHTIEKNELYRDSKGKLRFRPPMPLDEFRAEAKRQLENTLISIKAKNKVTTRNINASKKRGGTNKKVQLTPRGQLHLETIYGSHQQYVTKEEKVNAAFDSAKIQTVACKRYREALIERLNQFGGDAKLAFTGKNALSKNPVWTNEFHNEQVPEKVKTVTFETVYTVRKAISPDLKIDKVIDPRIRQILQKRLADFSGDAKKAFVNLEENPIWLNKEKGISIKSVTITGISNAIALHDKKDHLGNHILDKDGNRRPADFVNTGNNHHVAVYRKPVLDKNGQQRIDENGTPMYEIDEMVVPFFEAVERANQGLPIIDKSYKSDEGWQFLFTMKQNEYFVFPNEKTGFNPKEIDLLNPDNYAKISPNLFRVQKMSKVKAGNSFVREYVFRHHLETTVEDKKELRDITWKKLQSTAKLESIVKVRVNHIGQIVSVGEY